MQSSLQIGKKKHLAMFLRKRVENYVNLFKYGPQQGTYDWVNSKKRTIGGSEIATIMGLNKYSSVQQLVAQKVGLQMFGGSVKTRWGNLFEAIIQEIVEWDLDTKIMGEEISIPGIVKNQSYSPDGIGVVDTEITLRWLENMYTDKSDELGREGTTTKIQKERTVIEPSIVLFEFKCPFNRLPNGKIPEYYEPQVKTGLDTIRDNFGSLCHTPSEADSELIGNEEGKRKDKTMCDYGLYIEAQFRKCVWEDLAGDNPNYDRELTPGDLVSPRYPICYGFVGFYINPGYHELFKIFDNSFESLSSSEAHKNATLSQVAAAEKELYYAKLTAMTMAEIIIDDTLDRCSETFPTIDKQELSLLFPGSILTHDAIVSLLVMYYNLMKELKDECIDVVKYERVKYLHELPAGHIDRYCEFSDIGGARMPLMEILFESFQSGILRTWNSKISYNTLPNQRSENMSCYAKLTVEEETKNRVIESVDMFIDFIVDKSNGNIDVVGLFPWKLLRLDYHRIEKELGYVDKWKDKISDTIRIVDEINSITDKRKKLLKFAEIYGSTL